MLHGFMLFLVLLQKADSEGLLQLFCKRDVRMEIAGFNLLYERFLLVDFFCKVLLSQPELFPLLPYLFGIAINHYVHQLWLFLVLTLPCFLHFMLLYCPKDLSKPAAFAAYGQYGPFYLFPEQAS